MNRLPLSEEWRIQAQVVTFLKLTYPNVLFTTGLGGVRVPIGCAMKLKRTGYHKGTPDLMIFQPMNGYKGLFIEVKRENKYTVSEDQKQFIQKLNDRGYYAAVKSGYDEITQTIIWYMNDAISS